MIVEGEEKALLIDIYYRNQLGKQEEPVLKTV